MKTTIKTLVASLALLASTAAFATPVNLVGPESPNLQTVINNLYTAAGTSLTLAPDVNLNQVNESGLFQIEASGGSISTMVIEVAGLASTNTFGIYDLNNPLTYLQLFSGASAAGGQVTLSANDTFKFVATEFDIDLNFVSSANKQFTGAAFGYYLGSAAGPTFYSQAALNGGDDHMVAFQGDGDTIKLPGKNAGVWGSSSFILAWEDQPLAGSDWDYQDLVIYVESVTIPEPGSMALLGLGLAGLAALGRRKQRA